MESDGNGLYQWRMCAASGTGEVPVKVKQNSPVQFISTVKTDRERDLEGRVSAATSFP